MAHPVLSTCLTSRPMRQPRVRQIRSLFLSPSLVPWFGSLARVPVPCVQRPLNRTSSSVLLQILALCFVASLCPPRLPGLRFAFRVPELRRPPPEKTSVHCRRRLAAAAAAGTEGREGRRRGERGGGWALGKRHTQHTRGYAAASAEEGREGRKQGPANVLPRAERKIEPVGEEGAGVGELGWRSRLARLSQRRSKQAGEGTAAVPNCAVGRRPRLDGCGKELGGPKLASPKEGPNAVVLIALLCGCRDMRRCAEPIRDARCEIE